MDDPSDASQDDLNFLHSLIMLVVHRTVGEYAENFQVLIIKLPNGFYTAHLVGQLDDNGTIPVFLMSERAYRTKIRALQDLLNVVEMFHLSLTWSGYSQ